MQPHDRPRPFGGRNLRQINPDKLGRAAANIDDKQLLGLGRDKRRARDHREPRLFLGGDDLELEPRLTPNLLDELPAVLGAAAGFGGHQAHPCDVMAIELLTTDPQRVDGAVHRGAAKLAGALKPLPELHRLGKTVDHLKLAALWLGNQHPATIRAQIQSRIKRPMIGRMRRGALDRFRERARTFGTHGRHQSRPPFSCYLEPMPRDLSAQGLLSV